jgi:hypothetical protein
MPPIWDALAIRTQEAWETALTVAKERRQKVAFFRKRTNEDALNAEAFAHIGEDPFEDSPFNRKMTPEEGVEAELLFGRAAMHVASYVQSRAESLPREELQAAMMAFADAAAKAEFHLRCQKTDPLAVETWLAGHQEKSWAILQSKYPWLAGSGQEEKLIADARSLVVRNWNNVMTLASAYAASHIDVEGREHEFLDKFYDDPDDPDFA